MSRAAIARSDHHSGRCMVPGCGGRLVHDTNGNGTTVTWCTLCEQRVAVLRAYAAGGAPREELVRWQQSSIVNEGARVRAEEHVRELAVQVVQLRTELGIAMAQLERARPRGSEPNAGPVRMLLRALPRSRDHAMTTAELTKLTHLANTDSVRSVLNRLWRRGEVARYSGISRTGIRHRTMYYWRAGAA